MLNKLSSLDGRITVCRPLAQRGLKVLVNTAEEFLCAPLSRDDVSTMEISYSVALLAIELERSCLTGAARFERFKMLADPCDYVLKKAAGRLKMEKWKRTKMDRGRRCSLHDVFRLASSNGEFVDLLVHHFPDLKRATTPDTAFERLWMRVGLDACGTRVHSPLLNFDLAKYMLRLGFGDSFEEIKGTTGQTIAFDTQKYGLLHFVIDFFTVADAKCLYVICGHCSWAANYLSLWCKNCRRTDLKVPEQKTKRLVSKNQLRKKGRNLEASSTPCELWTDAGYKAYVKKPWCLRNPLDSLKLNRG